MATIAELRGEIIDTMKRRGEVAYWIEYPEGYGAMPGTLVCRSCYDKQPKAKDIETVTVLTLMDACTLAIHEDNTPVCDTCGTDIRESR